MVTCPGFMRLSRLLIGSLGGVVLLGVSTANAQILVPPWGIPPAAAPSNADDPRLLQAAQLDLDRERRAAWEARIPPLIVARPPIIEFSAQARWEGASPMSALGGLVGIKARFKRSWGLEAAGGYASYFSPRAALTGALAEASIFGWMPGKKGDFVVDHLLIRVGTQVLIPILNPYDASFYLQPFIGFSGNVTFHVLRKNRGYVGLSFELRTGVRFAFGWNSPIESTTFSMTTGPMVGF